MGKSEFEMVQRSADIVEVGVELDIDASRIDPELEGRLDLDPRNRRPGLEAGRSVANEPGGAREREPISGQRPPGFDEALVAQGISARERLETARPVSRPS